MTPWKSIAIIGLGSLLIGCGASPPPVANNQPAAAPSVTPPVVAPPPVSPPPVVSPPVPAPSGNVSTNPEELAVQGDIRKLITATFSNDLDTVMKYTHPRLIELAGGEAKLRDSVGQSLKKMLADGMRHESLEFSAPATFYKSEKHQFVIVPTRAVMVLKDKHIEVTSYQLGVRETGKNWTYLNGGSQTESQLSQLVPDLPKNVVFPATKNRVY